MGTTGKIPINLLLGHPSISLFPTSQLTNAVAAVFTHRRPGDTDPQNRHPLAYGPDQGSLDIRRTIGTWTSGRYGISPIPPEHLHISGGASVGLVHALQQFTDPRYTQRIFIVSPVYYLACAIFEDAGFVGKLTAINEGDTGCDVDALEEQLTSLKSQGDLDDQHIPPRVGRERKLFKYILYCVPTHGNPTGRTMTVETRRALVKLARKYDVLIISDDVYDFLSYTSARPPPRLVTIDAEDASPNGCGNTLSNCTFSKLLGPGLRCGWQEGATPKLPFLLGIGGANHSGGCASQWTSFVVEKIISSGEIDRVIESLQQTYGGRAAAVKAAIRRCWGDVTIYGGEGGYFLWVKVDVDARELVRRALEEANVILANGDSSECPEDRKGWGEHFVRVSVSLTEEVDAMDAIQRIRPIVESLRRMN